MSTDASFIRCRISARGSHFNQLTPSISRLAFSTSNPKGPSPAICKGNSWPICRHASSSVLIPFSGVNRPTKRA